MRVKLILFVIALFLLSSCTYEQPTNDQVELLTFIVDENDVEPQIKTFVIEEKNPLSWFDETKQQRYQQNLRRSIDEDKEEQEEIALRQQFANVRRIFKDDSGETEIIIGYDKDLDNPDFKEVESDKMGRMYSKHYTFKIE